MENRHIPISLALASGFALLAAVPAQAADFDQAVMMKWATVTEINYSVVGVYDGPHTRLFTGKAAAADEAAVEDRIEIELRWDQTTAQLVGEPTFKNYQSEVIDPRNGEPKCAPPKLTSPYEHFTMEKLENGPGGIASLTGTRGYAGGSIATFCQSAFVTVPAKDVSEQMDLFIPNAMILAMPATGSEHIVSIDAASSTIVTNDGKGWTWTFKLTPAS